MQNLGSIYYFQPAKFTLQKSNISQFFLIKKTDTL